jgi:hypothetical protein
LATLLFVLRVCFPRCATSPLRGRRSASRACGTAAASKEVVLGPNSGSSGVGSRSLGSQRREGDNDWRDAVAAAAVAPVKERKRNTSKAGGRDARRFLKGATIIEEDNHRQGEQVVFAVVVGSMH